MLNRHWHSLVYGRIFSNIQFEHQQKNHQMAYIAKHIFLAHSDSHCTRVLQRWIRKYWNMLILAFDKESSSVLKMFGHLEITFRSIWLYFSGNTIKICITNCFIGQLSFINVYSIESNTFYMFILLQNLNIVNFRGTTLSWL